MPIDETKPANSLLTTPEEMSPIQLQNRQGMRHESITDLESGYVTVLVVDTAAKLTLEQYARLLEELKERHGVRGMQTAFGCDVPADRERYRYDLHLNAHLRIEERQNHFQEIGG